MVFSEKRWMAVRFLSVLANSLVLALSLWTSKFLLVLWVLYKPQHQPHDFGDPGWQRWKSEGGGSTFFLIPKSLNSSISNLRQQISGSQVSGVRSQGRETQKLIPEH
jgi:hypothetical protein